MMKCVNDSVVMVGLVSMLLTCSADFNATVDTQVREFIL